MPEWATDFCVAGRVNSVTVTVAPHLRCAIMISAGPEVASHCLP